jgi:hypothetical protein
MANVFKNSIKGPAGTGGLSVYTSPSATVATVIGVNVANIVSQNINIDVQITDSSEGVTKYLVKGVLIVPGSSAILVGGEQKVVLEAGDSITVTSTVNSSADVVVSVLEIS